MHIAMNRFEVANGLQKQFEQSIKEQFEQLKGTRGYLSFHLIRGGTNGAVTFTRPTLNGLTKKIF